MSDIRPIGILDSGVGGLTAVKRLAEAAPDENTVFFGDTARAPYGDRGAEEIIDFTLQDVRFLSAYNLKALVIACNTITAYAIELLQSTYPDIPVVGTIEPSVAEALVLTQNKRIGILATQATVRSGMYEKALKKHDHRLKIVSVACPKLVPLIEDGHIHFGDALIQREVDACLAEPGISQTDTLILGCTHFPLIKDLIRKSAGESMTLVDSGASSVDALLALLAERDALANTGTPGRHTFFCSAKKERFAETAKTFLGRDISPALSVVSVD